MIEKSRRVALRKALSIVMRRDTAVSLTMATEHQEAAAHRTADDRACWSRATRVVVPLQHLRAIQRGVEAKMVRRYQRVLMRGVWDPPYVVQVGRVYVLWNGHHRVEAAVKLGKREMPVLVVRAAPRLLDRALP